MVKIFRDIGGALSFLTRIPAGGGSGFTVEDLADTVYVFPIVGIIKSLLLYIVLIPVLWITDGKYPLLIGLLAVIGAFIVGGIHHTDGLLDFGDGISVYGDAGHRIEVMHDVSVGAGGFTLGLSVYLTDFVLYIYLFDIIPFAVLWGEIAGMFAMVIGCVFGRSAGTPTASAFVMRNGRGTFVKSLLLYIPIMMAVTLFLLFLETVVPFGIPEFLGTPVPGYPVGIIFDFLGGKNSAGYLIFTAVPVVVGAICGFVMIGLSNRKFGGITGDCLGALHELTVPVSLLILLITA